MERITILTDLRGNKNPCTLTFAFINCNTVSVTLETQNMVYGNCQLSTVTLAIDIGVVQETGTVLAKPIFPFQKL